MVPWKTVLGRVILDTAIGITIGASFWTLGYSLKGKLLEAIKGNVEDAISILQALVIVGGFVGGIVGLAHGLAMLERLKKQNQGGQR
jgi:hypothetical protein